MDDGRRAVRGGKGLWAGLAAVLALGVLGVPTPSSQAATHSAVTDSSYSSPARLSVSLDGEWRFIREDVAGAHSVGFDDAEWKTVAVPHTWNVEDGSDGDGSYYRGVGWYRQHLSIPKTFAGRRIYLRFKGANRVATAFVNGTKVGTHQGGYAGFRFDITDAVKPGAANVIAVEVDNSPTNVVAPISGDFTTFGGLYRSVSVQAVNPVHFDMLDYGGPGVYATAKKITPAAAKVRFLSRLTNDSKVHRAVTVHTTVKKPSGVVVGRSTSKSVRLSPGATIPVAQRITIARPRLWNGTADPYQYRFTVRLRVEGGAVSDALTQPLGLRTLTISPKTGSSLNGTRIALRGVSMHQDRAGKGYAVNNRDVDQDFSLMANMGVNALRTAHYQMSQRVYDNADRYGFVVYTEAPLVGSSGGTSVPNTDAFRANIVQQTREMIRQTYNHPSVLLLGIGNEVMMQDDKPATNGLLAKLAHIVRTEAPGRISSYANAITSPDDAALTGHAEVTGYNRYDGWYFYNLDHFSSWLDELHAKDPKRPIGITEYGAGASPYQHAESASTRPPPPGFVAPWEPEEYQNRYHEAYLSAIERRRWLWGSFVWNMFDFASDGRQEAGTKGQNTKGLITYDRRVKTDAYYLYQANWTTTPVVYITSRRWTERSIAETEVKVYSNAKRVTLEVNGEAIGTKKGSNGVFTWPVRLSSGKNTVTARATIAGKPATDQISWTLAD